MISSEIILTLRCSNGCIRSDEFQFKRLHTGTADSESLIAIDEGFNNIDKEYNILCEHLNTMKECHVDKQLMHDLVGNLFFEQGVISSVQLNIVKEQLYKSENFRHIDDKNFSAYDLYNHITESLKRSHPLNYLSDHAKTHKLFASTFIENNEPVEIIKPTLEEVVEFAE